MKRVMLVFGTRPEAIKMAPLVMELKQRKEDFDTIVCVTGQHREMLDQVLHIFGIKPEYDLNIMKQGQDLYDITARVLIGMRDILQEVKPDVVLVHGDTTTSTAAALAAFYQQIPVGHVEAGLRTRNIYSPWPEEMNRQLTGRIATYNFAPTPLSRQNLLDESVADDKITVTGNTVIDALHWVVKKLKDDNVLQQQVVDTLLKSGYDVNRLNETVHRQSSNSKLSNSKSSNSQITRRLVLITGHRRENFGEGFVRMVTAMKDLAVKYPDVDFVYPMHLNPNVRKPIHEVFCPEEPEPQIVNRELVNRKFHNFFFIEPLEYLEFVYLMEKSVIVLTDSGGIQEEAPSLGKPVLVMRDTTERPEAVTAGTVKLVGTDYDAIVQNTSLLLDDEQAYNKMSRAVNPYGDGLASKRIAKRLLEA
ncbi:MAG: UDP-N-acetylglucosamine 2-epimerase (non-hydrolyzing) [Prevotella sp.]|nr:UDP-N-acetylglucosamine 2-epimerase (non-hydrolyzing) [Prevotella sp.]